MPITPRPVLSRLPALTASIPMIIIPVTVLSILLTASMSLHLSSAETSSLVVAVYALPGLLSLALTVRYRQPLILTGNVFALIFIASLGGQITYSELVGASILAGTIVLLVGVLGVTDRLALGLPAPIVLTILAGALLPWLSGVFNALGNDPLPVGVTILTYLLSRRYLGARLPPLLPALVVGLVIAALTGRLGPFPAPSALGTLAITIPSFSPQGIVSATPVLVVLIVVQSNLPSLIYLKSQGYHPPAHAINTVSGIGTLFGSLLGPTAVSLPLPLIPLAAGPDAGDL